MKEAKALLASWGRSFVAASLALYMAGETDPKKLGMAGLAAILPVVLRWLNPNDAAFGRKQPQRLLYLWGFPVVDTTDGSDIRARTMKTGKSRNANAQSVFQQALAQRISTGTTQHKVQKRLAPEDIHARLILLIGATLALTFLIVTVGVVYALIFVTQPIGAQAPNDAAFIDLLKTLAIFLTGSLGGVLAGNGLKSKPKPDTPENKRNA